MILHRLNASVFVSPLGIESAGPSFIALDFKGSNPLRLWLLGDGSMDVDDEDLKAADMGDGSIAIVDCTDRIDPTLRGAMIDRLVSIYDPTGCRIGVGLERTTRPVFCIWNWGDEFAWGDVGRMFQFDWDNALPSLGPELAI